MHEFHKNWARDNADKVENWDTFQKKVPTKMMKVDGPFVVETSEGELRCEDGYLAVDARGYVYPIATNEQKLIYKKVVTK